MNWHYSKEGRQLGPVSSEELRSMIAAGTVLGTDLAWREGLADWMPVSKIAELHGPSALGGVYTTSYQTSGSVAPYMGSKTSGLAIASLICGCIGLLGFVACFIPCLVGLGGVICGHMALAQIRSSQGMIQGRGLAIGGLITGYISITMLPALLALVFLFADEDKKSSSDPAPIEMHDSSAVGEEAALDGAEEEPAEAPAQAPAQDAQSAE
ncbi:MAG TPA: GYF domain-containing protein [Luteolibacter sp.]|nr:GYF domain-containing protein [Luteolibacter sp.]